MGVELQMGGADQWGNITAGLELIRRRAGGAESDESAHGIAYPLLLSPSGAKFGKSEAGESVWLDPERTSPYAFYQYWLNGDDRDVGTYLRWFTLMSREEIESLEAEAQAAPERRSMQRALAEDITTRVHGSEEAARAVAASEAAFSGQPLVDADVLRTLHDAADGFDFTSEQRSTGIARFLVETGVFGSLGEARRLIEGGGLTVADVRVSSPDDPVPEPVAGEWIPVRIGKRKLRVGRLVRQA
jgi:tyrosyl-tRNA synthetase